MWKVEWKIEDTDGKIFKPNIESSFLTTTEDKHNEDNAPPMERKKYGGDRNIIFISFVLTVKCCFVKRHTSLSCLSIPAVTRTNKRSEIILNETKAIFCSKINNFLEIERISLQVMLTWKEQNMLQCWQKRCVCLYVLHMILQCHKFCVKKVQKV